MKILDNLFQNFTRNTTHEGLRSLAFVNSPIASFISNENGNFLEVNQAFSNLLGYKNQELINESISILKSGKYNHQYYKDLWVKLSTQDSYSFEIYNRCKDGRILLFQEEVIKIKHLGKIFYIVSMQDITSRRELENRQQYLATHDPLTGLANRTLLKDRFSQAVFHTKRKDKKIVMFLCDLNEFKQLNDKNGHNFGDKVLKSIAKNLQSIVREGDTVSRYGGDEFVIIVEQLKSEKEIKELVNSIQKHSTIFVEDDNKKFKVSMSIGHACFPEDGLEFEQLIKVADSQMYKNKEKYYAV